MKKTFKTISNRTEEEIEKEVQELSFINEVSTDLPELRRELKELTFKMEKLNKKIDTYEVFIKTGKENLVNGTNIYVKDFEQLKEVVVFIKDYEQILEEVYQEEEELEKRIIELKNKIEDSEDYVFVKFNNLYLSIQTGKRKLTLTSYNLLQNMVYGLHQESEDLLNHNLNELQRLEDWYQF